MLKNAMRILALFGVILFVYYFIREGPGNIWGRVKELSILNFLILLILRLVIWSVRSFNWYIILGRLGRRPGLFRVFSARLGSHSLGYLTPAAKIGGEFARIFLLGDMDKKKIIASVVIDKMTEFIASIIIVCCGVSVSVIVLDINTGIKYLLFLITFSLAGVLIFFFRKQKEGILMWFRKRIRIGEKYLSKKESDIEKTDNYISGFYKGNRGVFNFLLLSNMVNYLIWIFEIFLTLSFIGSLNITLFKSFIIATLGSFAFIFPLLPGSLGIFEVTYLGLFELLGINKVIGVGYIIVRRILGLTFAGIGLFPVIRSGFNMENK